MMKRAKQVLALLLSLALLLGICGVAEEVPEAVETVEIAEEIPEEVAEEIPEEVAEEIPEESAEEAPEEIPEESAEEAPEEVVEEPAEELPEEPVEAPKAEQLNADLCPDGEHDIDYETFVPIDEYQHAHCCKKCGYYEETEVHRSICTDPTKCVGCGASVSEDFSEHPHMSDEDITYTYVDDRFHTWTCPDCGETIEYNHNIYCTQSAPYICPGCHQEIKDPFIDHRYGPEDLGFDEKEHWYICEDCKQKVEQYPHFTSCGEPLGVCSQCGASYQYSSDDIIHNYDYDSWEYDADSHWHACRICHKEVDERSPHWNYCTDPDVCAECGAEEVTIYLEHNESYYLGPIVGSDADCHWRKCEDCNELHKIPHFYKDGVCIECGRSDGSKSKASIKLIETATISQGESKKLKPKTQGLKKAESYTFKSSDSGVAVVSTGGKITAKAPGTATITVKGKSSKAEARCSVTVIEAPSSFVITPEIVPETLDLHAKLQLTASLEPAAALQEFTWTSSKPKIASVSKTGQVEALKEGKVKITVTATHKPQQGKSLSKSFTLMVVDPTRPTGIQIDPEVATELTMSATETVTLQLNSILKPATADSVVTWTIPKKADRSIAKVTESGELTPKKAGVVTVKATAKKKDAAGKTLSATVKITIIDPTIPTEVKITEESGTQIKKGEKLTLHATCAPDTAAGAELVWSSGNKKIATVNKTTGVVTALKAGTVTITAKAKKGGAKASIKIVVVKK